MLDSGLVTLDRAGTLMFWPLPLSDHPLFIVTPKTSLSLLRPLAMTSVLYGPLLPSPVLLVLWPDNVLRVYLLSSGQQINQSPPLADPSILISALMPLSSPTRFLVCLSSD